MFFNLVQLRMNITILSDSVFSLTAKFHREGNIYKGLQALSHLFSKIEKLSQSFLLNTVTIANKYSDNFFSCCDNREQIR